MNLDEAIEAIQQYKDDREEIMEIKPDQLYVFGERTIELEYEGDINPFEYDHD